MSNKWLQDQIIEIITQYLEELGARFSEPHLPYVLDPRQLAELLAPRIAAAIDAAGPCTNNSLAALRGER